MEWACWVVYLLPPEPCQAEELAAAAVGSWAQMLPSEPMVTSITGGEEYCTVQHKTFTIETSCSH